MRGVNVFSYSATTARSISRAANRIPCDALHDACAGWQHSWQCRLHGPRLWFADRRALFRVGRQRLCRGVGSLLRAADQRDRSPAEHVRRNRAASYSDFHEHSGNRAHQSEPDSRYPLPGMILNNKPNGYGVIGNTRDNKWPADIIAW